MMGARLDVVAVGEVNPDLILDGAEGLPVLGREILASRCTFTLGSSTALPRIEDDRQRPGEQAPSKILSRVNSTVLVLLVAVSISTNLTFVPAGPRSMATQSSSRLPAVATSSMC